MEPTDGRLAALYDLDNPDGPDHDQYRLLADRLKPRVIVDIGCGTGILTVTLAQDGRLVIGIDPDQGMLEVARNRAGSGRVTWILGDSRDIETAGADLVLMTGNVAQHIEPGDWQRTLGDIATGLRPRGVLSFESRNPAVRAWRTWQPDSTRCTRKTPSGQLTEWLEATEPDENGTVMLRAHNVFADTGEYIVNEQPLTFRTIGELTDDLRTAGLSVSSVWGGWNRELFNEASPIMVIEATAP